MTTLNIAEQLNELVENKQFDELTGLLIHSVKNEQFTDWSNLFAQLVENEQFNEWPDLLPKLAQNEQFNEQFTDWSNLFNELLENEQFNEWSELLPKLAQNEQFNEQFTDWSDLFTELVENEQFNEWSELLPKFLEAEQATEKQLIEWIDVLTKFLETDQFDNWFKAAQKIFGKLGYIPLPILKTLDEALADVREQLQAALKIEHTTIPVYLHMLYTLEPGAPWQVTDCIRSVVVEEMLHLVLVANVLNAIGGSPEIYTADFMPNFPTWLPQHVGDKEIQLLPFSREAVDQGLAIEQPEYIVLNRLLEKVGRNDLDDLTIGEFYTIIEFKLQTMTDRFGEDRVFCGDRTKQVTSNHYYYGGAGDVQEVYNLQSALDAIRQIKAQGEGANGGIWIENPAPDNETKVQLRPSLHTPAHYFRFDGLKQGCLYQDGDTPETGPTGDPIEVPWDKAYKTVPNSKLHDYPKGSEVRTHIEAFNLTYSELLHLLERSLNYEPERLIESVIRMCSLRDDYDRIVRNPYPGKPGYHAAPTFEFVANLPCPEKSDKKYL